MPGQHARETPQAAQAGGEEKGRVRGAAPQEPQENHRRTPGPLKATNAITAFPGFSADGLAVWDAFLGVNETRALRECAVARRARGEFVAARVGNGRRLQHSDQVRGDSTCWLGEPFAAAERVLMDAVETLRLTLNAQSYLGLFELELHYACYPPGAGYARHLDQLHGQERRRVSLIVYLNDGWRSGDGGELRLFGPHASQRDIAPTAGRLVCFLTAGQEHCVLPTRVDRLSVSGWFSARPARTHCHGT